MAFFVAPLRRAESDALIERFEVEFEKRGFGPWALERRDDGRFIGFTGLHLAEFTAPFTPAVEVGWRLAQEVWGQGYATEAARAALDDGFDRLGLDEVVSFTFVGNRRSRAVMERLGMTHDPAEDFDHPALAGHRLSPHVLYRVGADRWHRQRHDVGRAP